MFLLCRALARVILRLHLHKGCSREGECYKLMHTPPAPQEAMCEICISSFINLFICGAGLSSCGTSSAVLDLKTEEETMIFVLLIIVHVHDCPVTTHVLLLSVCDWSMALLPGCGEVALLMNSLPTGLPLISMEHGGLTELARFNYEKHEK